MTTNSLKINCVMNGRTPMNLLQFEVDSDNTVDNLRPLLKAKKPSLKETDVDDIIFWRVMIPIAPESLDKRILLEECAAKEALSPARLLSDVFRGQIPENNIHILAAVHVTLTITINSIESKTVQWTTIPSAATLDSLRDIVYVKHPTFKDRPRTLALVTKGCLPLFLATDDLLRTCIKSELVCGNMDLVMRLEDPPKQFSDITSADPFRLYGVPVNGTDRFDLQESMPSTKTLDDALHGVYIALGVATRSMSGHADMPGSQIYISFILMYAVALFPELTLKPGKEVEGRRAYGRLDYGIVSKTDPSRVLAVTTYSPTDFGTGIARNAVQLDAISSTRKQGDDKDGNATAPVVLYGIATDCRDWFLQKCTIDRLDDSGYNFPRFYSSRIPVNLNFAAGMDQWKSEVKEVFRHVVSHIKKMRDDIP
ncbi:MAG: hypothetical protein J3Q66DRAFT_439477 [Benniella sp.]|nr:MAG: hypothetical protein J3Q66DRAFT_439477 [Benniella sp.]